MRVLDRARETYATAPSQGEDQMAGDDYSKEQADALKKIAETLQHILAELRNLKHAADRIAASARR